MFRPTTYLALLALAACGPTLDHSETAASTDPTAPVEAAPEGSELQRLNAAARAGAVTENHFGIDVADPYRSLEEDTEATRAWIDAQSNRTRSALTSWERPEARATLTQALQIGSLGSLGTYGPHVFFSKREADQEQPAIYVRALNGQGEARLLIDPTTYGERAALDWTYPSPTGKYLAFGISSNGDERAVLHIMEVATGTLLDDRIEHCKWTDLSWLGSEDGFYYRRYPREGEENYRAEEIDSYDPRIFFHRIGEAASADPLVFAPSEPTHFASPALSDDDRYLIIHVARGWSQTDVQVLDRGANRRARVVAPDAEHPLRAIRLGEDAIYRAQIHRGQLYLLTNEEAPRYRLLKASIASLLTAVGRAGEGVSPRQATTPVLREIVPQSEATLDTFEILGDRIALHEMADVSSRLRTIGLDGRGSRSIDLPGIGQVTGMSGSASTGALALTFASLVNAPTLFVVRRGQTSLTELVKIDSPIDLTQFEVTRTTVASRDGTPIPVTYVHARGYTPNGQTPTLIYGYGGFNVSVTPTFTRHALYWLSRGGIYAIATLRGGGEFGEDWHRAGNLGNKEHVFEDMESVIRWVGTSGISAPNRIAITGGSNGGLLMGAMITRAPETFGAAASYVGLYDMIRFHRFPPAEIWVSEYGSADVAEQFVWLNAYSPYHRVRDGQTMPHVLVETADQDTRVYWGHSTKFVARLQEATGSADPNVYFFRESNVGHGSGTPVSVLVQRYLRMYTFIEHSLGM